MMRRLENISRPGALFFGGAACLLGATVMTGWLTGNASMVQWAPGIVPMQFNTSLAHISMGLALVCAAMGGRFRYAAMVCAVFAMILSFITGLQYITGDNYGIDALLMDPLTQNQTKTAFPGRMAPNTIICFLISSSALLVWHLSYRDEGYINAVMLMTSILMAFAITALAGYIFGIESAYGWWSMSNIAPQTAAGFFLEGLALTFMMLGRWRDANLTKNIWRPLAAALVGIAVTLAAAQLMLDQGRSQTEWFAKTQAMRVVRILERGVEGRVKELGLMQRQWNERPVSEDQWRADAQYLVDNYDSYRAIALMDRDFQVREDVSEPGAGALLRDVDFDVPEMAALATSTGPAIFRLSRGGHMEQEMVILFPLRGAGGFLAAICDFGKELSAILNSSPDSTLHYEVSDRHGVLLSNFSPAAVFAWEVGHEEKITLGGVPFTIRIYIDIGSYKNGGLVFLVFIFGMCISVLLGHALYNAGRLHRIARTLSENEAKLASILDNMVDGLITIDDMGNVQSYNYACGKIFGYAPEEVLGKNIKMLMPRSYAENHDQYLDNYKTTGIPRIIGIGREVEGQRKDGTTFPMDLSVAEVRQEGKRVFSGIVRDITERKKAEDQLKKINEELEQFAYIASHDLKAPLRGIDNLAKWIAEDLAEVLTEDAQSKMSLLRGRVSRLEMLLEDILQYSRAGRIVDRAVRVDTGDMVRKIVESLDLPEGFQVETAGDMPELVSSYTPLHQVFLNLVSNAYKHHDKKEGRIKISARDHGPFYEFQVSDDGPGIPEEFQERVFRMFQTLKPRDEKESSGLGLSIVKKLVEWQGGRVWVVSRDGARGTAFHFLWRKAPAIEERVKDAA